MSKKTKPSQVPLFIGKIYEIIENPDNSEAIGWTSAKDCFSIKSITKFTEEVLPQYFKHRNFASFIRQLNMYGFKKIRHSQGENVYMNENFKAGCHHLLRHISRKNKEEKEEQLEVYRPVGSTRTEPPLTRQIQQLRTNQRNLQEMCRYFMNQNQRVVEESQNFVKRLDSEEKEKEQKLEEILIYLLTQRNTHALLNSANQPQLSIASHQYNSPNLDFLDSRNEYLDNDSQLGVRSVEGVRSEVVAELSPLQLIDKAIKEKEELNKLRSMIQEIYTTKERKTSASYGIENHQIINKKDGNFVDYVENGQNSSQREVAHSEHGSKDDKHFFSINDFLNVEDENNPPPLFSHRD